VQFGTKPPFTGNATGVANEWFSGYGFNHFAVLRDLLPGTRYYYRYNLQYRTHTHTAHTALGGTTCTFAC
jgi:hypothetical protein